MKKLNILALALAVIISLAILSGCASNTPVSIETTTTEVPVEITTPVEAEEVTEAISLNYFAEVDPTSDNALELYREEAQHRNPDDFLSDEEVYILKDSGFEVHSFGIWLSKYDSIWAEESKYYYPVVYRYEDSLVLWYTTEQGNLIFETIYGTAPTYYSNYGGQVHYNGDSGLVMEQAIAYSLVYDTKDGIVSQYEFNTVARTYNVPRNSVYCGSSVFEGFIFRNGSDVYSLKCQTGECVCIAHDVSYVIDADYYYGSDQWCQPLFLMEDGRILAYIGWEMYGDAPDDPGHLLPLQYEGGYR